jgi:DNA-binding transcriptional LysR family regulator
LPKINRAFIIKPMSNFDGLREESFRLDTHALRLLVAVVDSGSITSAALALGVTQSGVSHQLDKLRRLTGDPLFVKNGRGIVPTARALKLADEARELLQRLQGFAHLGAFDPARWQATVTVAANDMQRDVLLPPLLARLRTEAPGVVLQVLPSNVPSVEMLRSGRCDLVISPRPPEGSDIVQKRLFEDRYRVFWDAGQRQGPADMADYLASDHITVLYEAQRPLALDSLLARQGVHRRFAVTVPGFAGVPAFLRHSPLLVTAPQALGLHLLRGLASADPPLPTPTLPMYLIWHLRHQHDEAHRWLRDALAAVRAPQHPVHNTGI